MEKNYSYTEFFKIVRKNTSTLQAEKLLNEIYMDLFLNYVHREQSKKRLHQLIDEALDQRNENAFLTYCQELRKLHQ